MFKKLYVPLSSEEVKTEGPVGLAGQLVATSGTHTHAHIHLSTWIHISKR